MIPILIGSIMVLIERLVLNIYYSVKELTVWIFISFLYFSLGILILIFDTEEKEKTLYLKEE